MCKRWTCIGVILIVSSGVWAGVSQDQCFCVSLDNMAVRAGPGLSVSGDLVPVAVGQAACNFGCGQFGSQQAGGIVGQIGVAGGLAGASGVCQTLHVGGGQTQTAGDAVMQATSTPGPGANVQGQGLGICLGQVMGNAGGPGGAAGAQGGLVGQGQILATPTGSGSQCQVVVPIQAGAVVGGPGSIGMVAQSAQASVGQSQQF